MAEIKLVITHKHYSITFMPRTNGNFLLLTSGSQMQLKGGSTEF